MAPQTPTKADEPRTDLHPRRTNPGPTPTKADEPRTDPTQGGRTPGLFRLGLGGVHPLGHPAGRLCRTPAARLGAPHFTRPQHPNL